MHWFFDPGISETSTHIAKSELQHFRSLRLSNGDQITISSGLGFGFVAKVVDVEKGELELGQKLISNRRPRVHLMQAIAKGGRDESALQACCEVGIASVTAFEAERSVANWKGKEQRNIERWEQIAASAMKQSQQLWLPKVSFAKSTTDLTPVGVGLVLDPRAEIAISEVEPSDEFSIVIGPEGGFSPTELDRLKDKGFTAVRLGNSVLRTSTAGVVATACLQLLSGDFGNA